METVGNINGKGTSNSTSNYNLIDPTPYKGLSYYRLKQTDLNGNIYYSPLVAVNFDGNTELNYSLYPNPNKGEFSIIGSVNENTEISIYNTLGQQIEYKINSKSNADININCSTLPIGIYL